jgi:hypothetical protein
MTLPPPPGPLDSFWFTIVMILVWGNIMSSAAGLFCWHTPRLLLWLWRNDVGRTIAGVALVLHLVMIIVTMAFGVFASYGFIINRESIYILFLIPVMLFYFGISVPGLYWWYRVLKWRDEQPRPSENVHT